MGCGQFDAVQRLSSHFVGCSGSEFELEVRCYDISYSNQCGTDNVNRLDSDFITEYSKLFHLYSEYAARGVNKLQAITTAYSELSSGFRFLNLERGDLQVLSENWDQDLQHLGMLYNLEMAAEREKKARDSEQRAIAYAQRECEEKERARANEKKAIRLVETKVREMRENIVNFYNSGISISVIAGWCEMTVEEVKAVLEDAGCLDNKTDSGFIKKLNFDEKK